MKTIEMTKEDVKALTTPDLRKVASELKIKNYSRFTKPVLQDKVIEVIELMKEVEPPVTKPIPTETSTSESNNEVQVEIDGEEVNVTMLDNSDNDTDSESTDTESEKTTVKSKKTAPKPGSKSETILKYMKENPTISKYAVAQHFDTYYSVVDRIEKRYILGK